MTWEFRDDRPIYTQLVEQITRAIVSGAFLPGERLLSVRDLAAQAGVNPNTMQRALAELERERLIYSQRTAGRFIAEDTTMIETAKNRLAAEQLAAFLAAMERLGYNREQVRALVERALA